MRWSPTMLLALFSCPANGEWLIQEREPGAGPWCHGSGSYRLRPMWPRVMHAMLVVLCKACAARLVPVQPKVPIGCSVPPACDDANIPILSVHTGCSEAARDTGEDADATCLPKLLRASCRGGSTPDPKPLAQLGRTSHAASAGSIHAAQP